NLRLRRLSVRGRLHTLGVNREAGTIDLQGALCAAKLDAAVIDPAIQGAGERHAEIVGVLKGGGNRVWTFPGLVVELARGGGSLGRRLAHIPLNDVDPVGKQVRQDASPEIPEEPPMVILFYTEGLLRRIAEKLFPVEFVLVDLVGCHPPGVRGIILVPAGVHEGYLAELARLDNLL